MKSSSVVGENGSVDRGTAERLVLGTAALGLAYGLPSADGTLAAPDESASVALIRDAWARGIRCFDTAPAYGEAESRLGCALPTQGAVWTKFDRRLHPGPWSTALTDSLAGSLQRLGRAHIDVFHWHNWTRAVADEQACAHAWSALRTDARIGRLACSTYGVDDALAAVLSGWFSLVQVEANVLNRSVLRAIGEPARARGVAIAVRSVFLQGVLTPKGTHLPAKLSGLQQARAQCLALAERLGMPLHHLALRALLADPDVAYVLIGVDRPQQLTDALEAATGSPLPPGVSETLVEYEPADLTLTDPRTWAR